MKKDVNVSLVQGGKLTKGGWLSIVSFLLVAVIALSVALGLVVKSHKEEKPAEEVYAGGGMVLPEEAEENGISLVSMEIPKEQYEDYGIMPIAVSSYSVTATAKAQSGGVELSEVQQKFNWSLAWASSNAADVNTYVSLSASEGARTATVSLLQPFSTKILLKCTWAYDDTKIGSVTLDYAKRFKGFNIQYASSVAKSASDESHLTTVLVEPSKSSDWNCVEAQMYFANPFAGGSWQDGPSNAVVFRVLEPVFDSVGTLENSVVSVRHRANGEDAVYDETSLFEECLNQMSVCPSDMPLVDRLNDYLVDSGSYERALNQCIPADTNGFTQIEFFKSIYTTNSFLDEVFGSFNTSPTDWQTLDPFIEEIGDVRIYSVVLPDYVVLQYGEMVHLHSLVNCFTNVDYLTASSIDFSRSNFIF